MKFTLAFLMGAALACGQIPKEDPICQKVLNGTLTLEQLEAQGLKINGCHLPLPAPVSCEGRPGCVISIDATHPKAAPVHSDTEMLDAVFCFEWHVSYGRDLWLVIDSSSRIRGEGKTPRKALANAIDRLYTDLERK